MIIICINRIHSGHIIFYIHNWFVSFEEETNDIQFQEHFNMKRSDFHEILESLFVKSNNIYKHIFRLALLLFIKYTGHFVHID